MPVGPPSLLGPSPPGAAVRSGRVGRCRRGERVMSRVLGEVAGEVGEEVQVERGPLGPVQFWRGQSRYLVGELLDSWVQTPPWWQRGAGVPGGASAELVTTQEVWRVEGGGGGGPPAPRLPRHHPPLGPPPRPPLGPGGGPTHRAPPP